MMVRQYTRADEPREGPDHGVPVRGGREHVRLPGQRRGRQDLAAAAHAAPSGERLRDADRAVDRPLRHAGQPTDLHLVAGVDHFVLAEGNTLVVTLLRNWLDKYFPVSPHSR